MKEEKEIYKSREGRIVRIVLADGGPWFCAVDVLKVAGLKLQQNTLNRMMPGETARKVIDGSSMRCVSFAGLLTLIPPKQEYYKARKLIVELIQAYSK